jgi:signal transduction histidine kinase
MPKSPLSPAPNASPGASRGEIQELAGALAEEQARRRRLESRILAAAGRERRRLAQALHDTLSQNLSGIHLMTAVLARKYAASCPPAAEELTQLSELVGAAAGEMQKLIGSLRASAGKPDAAKDGAASA